MARPFPSIRAPRREHEAILVRRSDGSTWVPDVVVSVDTSTDWSVTDHPVEEGVSVSDHVQRQPTEVTLSVVLTENPTKVGGRVGGPIHLQQSLEWLRETADAGELVDIVTRRDGVMQGFAITSLPFTMDRVARLAFPLTLREVRVAVATTVQITVEETASDTATGAPDEVDVGEQSTTSTEEDPEAEEADQSVLAALTDWL